MWGWVSQWWRQPLNQVLSGHSQHLWVRPALCSPIHWPRSHLSYCHRLRAEACSFFTSPFNPSSLFFFLLFLLCFSFPFPPFTLFPVSLFILVKQIPLTPVPLCFPYYTSLLPLSLSLHQFSWRVSPQGLVLCCRWITENSTSRVRKAGSAGAEDTAQSLCAQTVGKTVSWAWTECHSPEFCPVNLSNFLFQLLWMFREKLELGAVAFRVFPWVIISNLRLQK